MDLSFFDRVKYITVHSPNAFSEQDIAQMLRFDYTKLSAINTCPRWGIMRYEHHKTMALSKRQMALEAGHAAHEVFAAHRLYHVLRYQSTSAEEYERVVAYGTTLFPNGRMADMLDQIKPGEDDRLNMMNFCLQALYNGGFYDDPDNRRKSLTEVENTVIHYMDKYGWRKEFVYVTPTFIGIEVPVNLIVVLHSEDEETLPVQFVGKIDGVHFNPHTGRLRIHENKTASRLGDAWASSFQNNFQPTGYMVAAQHYTGQAVTDAKIIGSCLPMPRSNFGTGLEDVNISRESSQFDDWIQWVAHTAKVLATYRDNPFDAPMYTHSCNRYFSACMFTTFCSMPREDREVCFHELETDEWSPIEKED